MHGTGTYGLCKLPITIGIVCIGNYKTDVVDDMFESQLFVLSYKWYREKLCFRKILACD